MDEPYRVYWNCLRRDRAFKSFCTAERFARRLVRNGEGQPRDVEITYRGRTVATIDRDALDRIWTDVLGTVLV